MVHEIPSNLKRLLFGMGARWHALMAMVMNFAGLGCLIVGIVGDVSDKVLGLEPTNWFIMAAALWLWALAAWICGYMAAKEG